MGFSSWVSSAFNDFSDGLGKFANNVKDGISEALDWDAIGDWTKNAAIDVYDKADDIVVWTGENVISPFVKNNPLSSPILWIGLAVVGLVALKVV